MICPENTRIVYLLAFIFLLMVASPAQAKEKRIVVLKTMSVPVVEAYAAGIVDRLKSLGYGGGVEVFNAEGNRERAEELLDRELNRKKPDVVVTVATLATQAAVKLLKGTDIPVIFCVVADPVGAGVAPAVGRATGCNVTGFVHSLYRDLKVDIAKRLIHGIDPNVPVVGMVHSDYPSAMGDAAKLQKVAHEIGGLTFADYVIPYRDMPAGYGAMTQEVRNIVTAQERKVNYWWLVTGPLSEQADYADIFVRHSTKPLLMGNTLEHVRRGALCAVVPDIAATAREVATLAVSVMDGLDPGTVPVVVPDSFNLGINLSTALALGIVVPPDLLALAGKNVYR